MLFFLKAIVLCTLFLTTSVSVSLGQMDLKDILDLTERLQRMKQQKALQEQLRDQRLFRPSPEERDAVANLLQEPRHIMLLDGDVKFLESLLRAPAWTGADQRIMHAIWKQVTGATLQ